MKRAFTLIELLVVIAIIAILAAILFPVFAQAKDAAKNTSALSNCKQISTSMLIYAGDADDLFPIASLSNSSGWDTWQGIIQPYTKSWQIIQHPKMSPPSGNQAYWIRLQHWGVLGRATANTGATTNTRGYYVVPSSIYWPYPSGTQIKVDGIFGAGVDPNVGWYASRSAPSLSQTQIADLSNAWLVGESGNWDMWSGVFADVVPFRTCGGWRPEGDWMYGGFLWSYAGPHARKKPNPNTTTTGGGDGFGNGCAQPNGLSTFVAADGSAKSKDWRGQLTKGTQASDGSWYMNAFWPTGG